MRRTAEIVAVLIVALIIALALSGDHPVATESREAIIERGQEDTGARNLVASVYLGYRAFDTFGETIVLLVSVSGVIYLLAKGGKQ